MWDLVPEARGFEPQKGDMADIKKETKQGDKSHKVAHRAEVTKGKEGKTASKRGKKYLVLRAKVEHIKAHSIMEAIKLVKEVTYTTFDATIEMHVRVVSIKKKKEEEMQLRGTVKLPSGSPKTRKVAIASDELIETVKKGKIDFDILLATPEMMPKLAVVAKILGPKGKMPSPKAGTITTDPEKTKTELSTGLIEYKTDAHGIIHLAVGKVSWEDEKLQANIETILGVLPKKNITSITLASTMSPGIKVIAR